MAWITQGFSLQINLVDAGGNRGARRYEMVEALYADVVIDTAIVLAALEAVCAAGTASYTISETFVNDAFALPAAGVQIEAGALLVMQDDTNPLKRHTTTIPAPETDVFVETTGDNANVVDIAHQDVIDYAELFSTNGECFISDGEHIDDGGLLRGHRVTRKSSRG